MAEPHARRQERLVRGIDADALVDQFVAKVNAGYREPVNVGIDKAPSSVLVGEVDGYGFSDWMIKAHAQVDWIDPLESQVGHRFPLPYRSLVTRYIFPAFEAGGLFLFANTPEGTDYHELRSALFRDRPMYDALSAQRLLQFGRPGDGTDYDPACFDLTRASQDDCPVVRVDHEDILCRDTVRITEEITPSFREFLLLFTGDA